MSYSKISNTVVRLFSDPRSSKPSSANEPTPFTQRGVAFVQAGRRPAVSQHRHRDPDYLAWIATLPCLVAGRRGVQLAHVDYSDAGYGRFNPGGAKIDDHSVVPLAPDVHQGGKHAQHSPGQAGAASTTGGRRATSPAAAECAARRPRRLRLSQANSIIGSGNSDMR